MTRNLPLLLIALFALSACGGAASYGTSTCKPNNNWGAPSVKCPKVAEVEPEEEEPEEEWPEEEVAEEPEPVEEPEVVVTEEEITIGERIQFKTGKAKLRNRSKGILDKVAETLKENPDIKVVRIEGHTDARGGRRYNRKLSKKRAKAVRRYLIDQGISSKRLEVKGFGQSKPLASNGSRKGRFENRRVEFKILKRN